MCLLILSCLPLPVPPNPFVFHSLCLPPPRCVQLLIRCVRLPIPFPVRSIPSVSISLLILYCSCRSGHKILVTSFLFRTAVGNLFLCTVQSRVAGNGLVFRPDICVEDKQKLFVIGEKFRGYSISEGRLAFTEESDKTVTLYSDSKEESNDL